MLNIRIEREYAKSDLTFGGDAYEVRLFVDMVKVMSGDYYHDRIEDRIKGFLVAVKLFEYDYTITEVNINSEHDWD